MTTKSVTNGTESLTCIRLHSRRRVDHHHKKNVNEKFFHSHKAHTEAPISVSLIRSQTPVYTARSRIRG